jgi:acetyl esterase/lipase
LETRVVPRISYLDLNYADDNLVSHRMDVHLPDDYYARAPLPVIVWIHGGGWLAGSKADWGPAQPFVNRGYAVASVNYRLTSAPDSSIHPAQLHDVKAAVRWLRDAAPWFNIDPNRFAAWGSSAGGHLAAFLGTTGGVEWLDGAVGNHLSASSRVRAVVDYYGPTDLYSMWQVPGYESHGAPNSPESQLIGATLRDNPWLAALASPNSYTSTDDPPFLIAHGTADPVVPPSQSQIMHDYLQYFGVQSTIQFIQGAGHGGPQFTTPAMENLVATFLEDNLRSLGSLLLTPRNVPAGLVGYDFRLVQAATTTTGVLVLPQGNGPYPGVVINHGAGGNAVGFGLPNAIRFAQAGYAAIAPTYTHSMPSGPTPWDNAENRRRAQAVVDILDSLPQFADGQPAMYGNSMGAFLTIALAEEYDYLKVAGLTAGGVREGGVPPAERVWEIDAPLSVHHGTADTTVPISLARTFRDYLTAYNVGHEYYEYEGVGHNLWQVQTNLVFSRMIAFFDGYVSPGGAPGRGGSPGPDLRDPLSALAYAAEPRRIFSQVAAWHEVPAAPLSAGPVRPQARNNPASHFEVLEPEAKAGGLPEARRVGGVVEEFIMDV